MEPQPPRTSYMPPSAAGAIFGPSPNYNYLLSNNVQNNPSEWPQTAGLVHWRSLCSAQYVLYVLLVIPCKTYASCVLNILNMCCSRCSACLAHKILLIMFCSIWKICSNQLCSIHRMCSVMLDTCSSICSICWCSAQCAQHVLLNMLMQCSMCWTHVAHCVAFYTAS